jgi:predicted nucleic-acid-binding Zn-ribbon protein
MQKITECPNCGAESAKREWTEANGGFGPYRAPLKIKTDVHKNVGAVLKALVCKHCGYVQLFVDPLEFK